MTLSKAKSVKTVQVFLSQVQYYRRFIQHFAETADITISRI